MRTTQELLNYARKYQTIGSLDYEMALNQCEQGLRPHEEVRFAFTGSHFTKSDGTGMNKVAVLITEGRILIGGQVKVFLGANYRSVTFSFAGTDLSGISCSVMGSSVCMKFGHNEIIVVEDTQDIAVNIVRDFQTLQGRSDIGANGANGTEAQSAANQPDLFHLRKSVRKYESRMVPQMLIDQVIEAGLQAASGMNHQGAAIISITDKTFRDKLASANAAIMDRDEDPFYGAPVILLVVSDRSFPTYLYDGSLVLGNMMLKAAELGLGSCWIHRAKEEMNGEIGHEIRQRTGLTGDYEGIGHLALGYAAEEPEEKPAKQGRVFYI